MARRPPTATRPTARATSRAATRSTTRPAARPAARPAPDGTPRPDVIVDFTVDRSLLFVSLHNLGAASAYDITTRFDRRFHGLGGRTDITTLALFQTVPFLPPGKHIAQLVDTVDAYFRRREPSALSVTLTYRDRDGQSFKEVVRHDLAIYRDAAEALVR